MRTNFGGPLLLCLLLLLGAVSGAKSQQRVENQLLTFENLAFDSIDRRVYYEQRVYRNPLIGLLELQQALHSRDISEFVPLYQGIPIASYRMEGGLFQTILLSQQERAHFAEAHPFEGKKYKFDFRLQPDYKAIYGYREQPLQTKINLLLQSQLYLTRGLVFNWGVLFPITNDIDNQQLNIRPAPLFLNQFSSLGKADFLSASAGLFYNDQYGFNAQYRHADLTSPWSFGVETSLTGYYFFPPSGLYYEPIQELMLLADVAYRINAYDLTIKVSGGQYMYLDRGGRLDILRQFNNVDIGFFLIKTVRGSTGGFNFAIPIPPGKIAQSKRLRLRSSEEFKYEYNYSRGSRVASRYQTGYQLDALLRQYHQGYLGKQYRQYWGR